MWDLVLYIVRVWFVHNLYVLTVKYQSTADLQLYDMHVLMYNMYVTLKIIIDLFLKAVSPNMDFWNKNKLNDWLNVRSLSLFWIPEIYKSL
jgi:hypothetical protein